MTQPRQDLLRATAGRLARLVAMGLCVASQVADWQFRRAGGREAFVDPNVRDHE